MRALPGRASRSGTVERDRDLSREAVGEAQRRRIRRATGELVAKRGFGGVTVELIVKRARVGFKTFYKHYANKEEAFLDLFDRTLAATEAVVAEAAGAERPWPERVAIAVRDLFKAILADPLVARACLVEAPTAGPKALARYERLVAAFVPLLREGRSYAPEAAALPDSIEETLVGALLWSAYQRLNFSEIERIEDQIPENVELVLRPYVGEREAAKAAAAVLGAPA